ICFIGINPIIPTTELRPNFSPTTVQGDDYTLCDVTSAYNIANSQNFRCRFDPDTDPNNGNEIFYLRNAGNPQVRLSWVTGLVPGITYHVGVEVQVDDIWSGFSTILPLTIAPPPNNVVLRNPYCGGIYAPNSY